MRFARLAFFLLVTGVALAYLWGPRIRARPPYLSYSELLHKVESRQVRRLTLTGQLATGMLARGQEFRCQIPRNDPHFHAALREAGVDYGIRTSFFGGPWGRLPVYLLVPVAMFYLLWRLIARQASEMSNKEWDDFGPTRRAEKRSEVVQIAIAKGLRSHQLSTRSSPSPRLCFDDVGGLADAKEQLRQIIDFLREPEKYQALGAKIPKGVVLVGPSGCGKTLMMRVVADEADVPYLHVSGSEFDRPNVGEGAARVRKLFEMAKSTRPCLLFLDHLDGIGADRRVTAKPDRPLPNQTANDLAAQMDGFEPNAGIIVIVATHWMDLVDPLLLRAGRLDRVIRIEKPDASERREILELHTAKKPLSDEVDLAALAEQMDGLTGADIANIVNEAAFGAARGGKSEIGASDFEEAVLGAREATAAAEGL